MAATTAAVVAGVAAVGGAAASYAGAKKNAAAMRDANAANVASQDAANRLNYQRWLESQGVGPNGEPVNTFLPRYLTMPANALSPTASQAPRRFRKIGSADNTYPQIGSFGRI